MNDFVNKPSFGGLFKNSYKEPGDSKPNWKGTFAAHRDIKAGEEVEIAAWEKEGRKGMFLSLKVSDKREQTSDNYYPDENAENEPESNGGDFEEPSPF